MFRHINNIHIQKIIFISIFLIIFLAIFSVQIKADGGVYIQQESDKAWKLFNEGKQLCAINYKDGYENMLLTIDTREQLTGTKAVWIFPVPSSPDKTVINIAKGFPQLYGQELDKSFDKYLPETFSLMSATQIYPLPLLIVMMGMWSSRMGATSDKQLLGDGFGANGVAVYEHIEKYGLTTELVSISNAASLNDYLSSKGLVLDNAFMSKFDSYVGSDNSLVISWISDVKQYKLDQANISQDEYYLFNRGGRTLGNVLGVSITFPTDKMYFPLKPTSVYGSTNVPAVIYVIGQVQPELYSDIKPYTKISYFYSGNYYVSDNMKGFFFNSERIKGLTYTKIEIDAPAKYYTQDLWINNVFKPVNSFKIFFLNNFFITALLLFLLLSIISSIIAAAIIFSNDSPNLFKFGLFGMLNALTLVVFASLANWLKIDQKFTKSASGEIIIADNKKILFSTLKITGVIMGIIFAIILSFMIFVSNMFRYGVEWFELVTILVYLILIYLILVAFLRPFVRTYYNNRKMMKYLICFTITFLILLILTWILLANI